MTTATLPDITTKYYAADEVNFTPGERSFVCWVSTELVDREKDVVIAAGVDFKSEYMANPVVMAVHDYGKWPLGQCEWLKVKASPAWTGLYGKAKVDDDQDTEVVWRKIQSRTVRGISIGFRPPDGMKAAEWGPPTADELRRNPHWKGARRIIRRCVMIEMSVCPIGMNPAALIEAVSKGLHKPHYAEPAMSDTDATSDADSNPDATDEPTDAVVKAAVPFKAHPVKDEAWDAAAAVDRLRKWASSDGSGSKDTMDWGKYAEGFAVVDGPKDAFDSYKLPHHDVVGGKLVTVPAAVSAALGAINGARGGYEGADKAGAKSHLEQHEAEIKPDKDKPKPEGKAVPPPDKEPFDDDDDFSDEPDEDEDDGPIRKGSFVKVVKSKHKGVVGKVASVHRAGLVPDVEDDVPGSKDDPAVRIKCFKAMGDGHRESEYHVACKMAHCEKCEDLRPPTRKGGAPDPVRLPPIVGKSDDQVAAERLAEIRKSLTPAAVRTMVERERDKMLGAV